MSLGSAKSSSGSTPSESSGSSMADASSILSSIGEPFGSSSSGVIEESSSVATPLGESSSASSSSAMVSESAAGSAAGSGHSAGSSSGECSFYIDQVAVLDDDGAVFRVTNDGTVPLDLISISITHPFWTYEPLFPVTIEPGGNLVISITTSAFGAWGATCDLETSCGTGTFVFPSE